MLAHTSKLLPLVAVVMALGACAGGGDDAGSGDAVASLDTAPPDAADDSPSATTEPIETEQAMLEFAACMREHGVDMADPQVDENGGVQIQIGEPGDDDAGRGAGLSDEMQDAMEACRELMPQGPITRDGDDFDPTEMQDELLEFAACMREHGVDMPDPEFSEEGGIMIDTVEPPSSGAPTGPVLAGPFGTLDLSDPATAEAFEACGADSGFGPPGGGVAVPAPSGEDDGR